MEFGAGGQAMPPIHGLQHHLSRSAKRAADAAGWKPDRKARRYLGVLVRQAVTTLGPDPSTREIAEADKSFARLAQAVASRAKLAGAGYSAGRRLARRPSGTIEVGEDEIKIALDGLCPGFFPFC